MMAVHEIHPKSADESEEFPPSLNLRPRRRENSRLNPILNRRSEDDCTYFRCGRYFTIGHEWYATVREGTDLGPFLHRMEAEVALVKHVADLHIGIAGGIADIFARSEGDATEFEKLVREVIEYWEQRHLRSDNSAYVWIMQRLETINGEQGHSEIESRVLERLLAEMG